MHSRSVLLDPTISPPFTASVERRAQCEKQGTKTEELLQIRKPLSDCLRLLATARWVQRSRPRELDRNGNAGFIYSPASLNSSPPHAISVYRIVRYQRWGRSYLVPDIAGFNSRGLGS